jgi:CheY-like chemotaxis protein
MLRVLVVEDDELLRRALVRGLDGDAEVRDAGDAERAFAELTGGARFDIILLDLSVTDAVAFVARVEQIAAGQQHRVVLFTGVLAGDLAPDVRASVGDRVLEKPASLALILETARALRERHGPP